MAVRVKVGMKNKALAEISPRPQDKIKTFIFSNLIKIICKWRTVNTPRQQWINEQKRTT